MKHNVWLPPADDGLGVAICSCRWSLVYEAEERDTAANQAREHISGPVVEIDDWLMQQKGAP